MCFSFLVMRANYLNQWTLPSKGLDIFRIASCIAGAAQGNQRSLEEIQTK